MNRWQRSLSSRAVKIPLIWSVALGAAFGLFFRLMGELFRSRSGVSETAYVMTIAFLVLGPLAIGYITVSAARISHRWQWISWLFLPWPAVLLSCGIVYLLNLEGLICVMLYLPGALLLSSLGGLIAGLVCRRKGTNSALLTCVAIIPLLLAPLESLMDPPVQTRVVATEIRIHASEEEVWSNIERVKTIHANELAPTWTHSIGFPRPLEATLSHGGVGGVRHASFEHGLMFIETVTRWEPDHVLAFSIKADTAQIPATTLDEHVTIGGRYFDVLQGEYRLERLIDGDILLHLSSQERLSTDFNEYAGFWSDAIMRSLQESILKVVKSRCEAAQA